MANRYLESQLRDSEQILAIVRRSPIAHLGGWITGVLAVIFGFFFLYPLLQFGRWGLLGLFVVLLFGIVFLVRTGMMNRMNVLVLTSERVIDIDQQGMFSRVVSECLYENIQEMSFQVKGILGTVFHVGTLRIHTQGDRADISVTGIKDPQRVQDMIGKIQKKVTSQSNERLSATELVELLEKIRSQVDIPGLAPSEKKDEVKQKKSTHE